MNIVHGADAGDDADESGETEGHGALTWALKLEYQASIDKLPQFATIVKGIAQILPTDIKNLIRYSHVKSGHELTKIETFLRSQVVMDILNSTYIVPDRSRGLHSAGVKTAAPITVVPNKFGEEQLAA